MDERRQKRVADAIRDELAELIVYELTDPRVRLNGVTEVHLAPDGKRADVLVHTSGGELEQEETIEALKNAGGFLKRQLSLRLSLRHVPDLRFLPDSGTESGDRLEVLWKRAQKWRKKLDSKQATPGDSGGSK